MGDVIINNTGVAVEEETTEGTLVLPSAAASFIAPLADGLNDITIQAKESLERANSNASLDKSASVSGIKFPSGTIGVEYKSGDSEAAPEYGVLLESGLGATEAASGDIATTTGHSTTLINMVSTSAFAVNEIVVVKEVGGEIIHCSPIASLVTDTSITLLVAYSASFADTVTVKKMVDYRTADSGHTSFSVTKYSTGSGIKTAAVRETGAGCKTTSIALSDWVTGAQPKLTFAYEGMVYTNTVAVSTYDGTYDTATPIVALGACIYKDSASLPMDAFAFSVENTLEPKTTTCDTNGRTGLRVTDRNITGTVTPYKSDSSVSEWDDWDDNTTFSIFGWSYNSTTAGNKEEIVAFFIPNCQYSESGQSDKGGLAQNAFSFKGLKDSTGPTVVMAFC